MGSPLRKKGIRIMNELNHILLKEWKQIRALTYDYLEGLTEDQLALRLPFPESQPMKYQFWCMAGAHESYLNHLRHGEWVGFACSLNGVGPLTSALIKRHLRQADAEMEALLPTLDLMQPLKDGKLAYEVVMQMIRHEMQHHGQLINLMFCHHLPIPESWQREWALSYEH